jgi:hypothetical protein
MDTLHHQLWVVVTLVGVALLFDFMNGFHDAANSIATIVSTRVLKPHQAVIWAAAFNFLAYFLFQLKVASTIGKGTIDPVHCRSLRRFWRADRGDCLEHHHLVLRHSLVVVARAGRRPGRRSRGQGRDRQA